MENFVDFYEIYDYYALPFWQTTWFKILIILLIILSIAIIFFIRLRKKKKTLPWQEALQELKKLESLSLTNKDDYRRLYFHLTKIIKTYLNQHYGWSILDKTDQEVIQWLKEKNFTPELTVMLEQVTQGAQLVKFANMETLKSQAEIDIKTAQSLIEQTHTIASSKK